MFSVAPEDVPAWLEIDHEVWTLGEAAALDRSDLPFLSKEVWLDDSRPGEVTVVFVWPDRSTWDDVGNRALMERLTADFDRRFGRPYELIREAHIESGGGLHRWSRFARPDDPGHQNGP